MTLSYMLPGKVVALTVNSSWFCRYMPTIIILLVLTIHSYIQSIHIPIRTKIVEVCDYVSLCKITFETWDDIL